MSLLTTTPKFDFENHPKVIAIVGSREYSKKHHVTKFLERLRDETIVVSGGAKAGIDRWVKETIAKQHQGRLFYKEFGVTDQEWKVFGKPAGPIRNECLVFYMSLMERKNIKGHTIIFANYLLDKQMYTPGSNNVILLAKKYDVPHSIYDIKV